MSTQNDGWGAQFGGMITAWVPLMPCGADAPALEVVLDPNAGNWPAPSLTDLVNPLKVEDRPYQEAREKFGAEKCWRPEYEPGDLMLFSHFTYYRTFFTREMRRPTVAIEIKFLGDRPADERGVMLRPDGRIEMVLQPEKMKVDKASIAVLLPEGPAGADFDQRLAGLRLRFGPLDRVTFLTNAESVPLYSARLPGLAVAELTGQGLAPFNIVVDMVDSSDRGTRHGAGQEVRTYHVFDEGRIVPDVPGIDSYEYPYLDAHPFNRRAPRTSADKMEFNCFYYFPYGYLHRVTGLGPINEFGHRIEFDFRTLADRGPEHKVVACFGGSAGFSVCCLHDQMYTKVMERRLNELSAERAAGLKFTVLNFGQPGNVTLNEIFHYVLFCHRIRPDIVVSHDGANDLGYAAGCDGFLVETADIVYQQQLETWSELLHNPIAREQGTPNVLPTTSKPATSIAALRSYVARKRQFSAIVRAHGGRHVWGLQPLYLSKPELSPVERDRIWDHPRVEARIRDSFANYVTLYETFLANKPDMGDDVFVDFHTYFHSFGAAHSLLADVVHLLPEGDRVVGEHYAETISREIVPAMTGAAA
jgi:hypothetical protein